MARISQDLVRDLMRDPSPENRERSVMELTEVFKARAAHGRAATMLEEIIRIFANDAAVRVRRAISEQLKNDPDLPHDVALSLAHDVDDVAMPVLSFSRVLSDADLMEVVAKENNKKMKAIAGREQVGEALSDALIDHGDADTVGALMANAGSNPSEGGMLQAVKRFATDNRVQAPLARRERLPKAVMTKMVAVVSDHVLKELSARNDLPDDLAENILKQAEERVFVDLSRDEVEPEALAENLADLERLTPNLAMRALLGGEIPFFEQAAVSLCGMQLDAVRELAYAKDAAGVAELCQKMGAPEKLEGVFAAGLAAYQEVCAEEGAFDKDKYQALMVDRVLSDFEMLGVLSETDDLDALIDRLRAVG